MLVGTPEDRYRFDGEYIQTPTIRPRIAEAVPAPEDHTTSVLHCGPCFLKGVKYSQCGMAPTHAPSREARVVYCSTSPVASDTYTCSPFGHEYFHSGLKLPNTPSSVLEGVSAMTFGTGVSEEETGTARAIFESVGKVLVVDERLD